MARRIFVCLAFATWCFLNTWVGYAQGRIAYFTRYDPLRAVAWPVLCCELVLALGMWLFWELCIRLQWRRLRILHIAFLLASLVPLGIAAVALLSASPVDLAPLVRNRIFWPAALFIAIAPIAFAILRPIAASRAMRSIFLYSWPVLALVYIQAARATLLRYPSASYSDAAPAPRLAGPPPPVRVIWIIFDELSQTIAFGNRPAGLSLPNFDRLRNESIYATAAQSPANMTEVSMPALILGRMVAESIPDGPRDLQLRMPGGSGTIAWNSVSNVFDQARDLGLNTAVVGWAHPYGRVLNRSLTESYWIAGWMTSGMEETFERQPLPQAMWYRVKLQVAALPLLGHFPGMFPGIYPRQEKATRFLYLMDRAREVVSDPAIGLALIHLPIPHPPAIYSRAKGAITAVGSIGYLDSVQQADGTLGSLRRAIENAGLEDRTAILVSADHGWRTNLWRGTAEWTPDEEAASHQDTSGVPFLLKLPGQTSGTVYASPFNTVITRRLLVDVLEGRLNTAAEFPDFIAREQTGAR